MALDGEKYKMRKTFRLRFAFSRRGDPKFNIRDPKLIGIVVTVTALTMCESVVHAQQPTKIPTIALLSGGSRSIAAERIGAFRQGLRELGYLEGKNIVIEERYSSGETRSSL